MVNRAKTEYIAVLRPDAAGKEPLKKTRLAASISAFLDAHAPGVQVSSVVALQNMIRWRNFKPDGLFFYDIGNTLSGAKTIMYVPAFQHFSVLYRPRIRMSASLTDVLQEYA
jgi:hypothetical protein